MTTAAGCKCTLIKVNRKWMKRIRFGEEGDLAWGYREFKEGDRCPDCAAKVGNYHHPGCDMEACPRCGEQIISCGCDVSGELAWEE